MNLFAPVSSLMTDHTHLETVSPDTPLSEIKTIFESNTFHHLPVVHFRELVGLISRTDFDRFWNKSRSSYDQDRFIDEARLRVLKAEDLMTTKLAKVESDTRLNVVVEIFTLNRFHALPVVDNGELVGIITPFDLLKALNEEKPTDPLAVYSN
jgi:acetoin utilization protein AcuB